MYELSRPNITIKEALVNKKMSKEDKSSIIKQWWVFGILGILKKQENI